MTEQQDVALAPLTTLGVGGAARRFTRVTSLPDLEAALQCDEPILILGGGSNLVIGDAGWDGLAIQIALPGIAIHDDGTVIAAAGEPWDALVAQVIVAGLAGVECMSGIPGLVGATPMQNVGAYGQEVADTIARVRVLDRETGTLVDLAPRDCHFAYRTSLFKGSARWVVVEVELALVRSRESLPIRYPELAAALGVSEGERAPLARVRETVIELRRKKGMVLDPGDPESRSAGSFFMNPLVDASTLEALRAKVPGSIPHWPQPDGRIKLSAGWLIERAGFHKGYTVGRVGISHKHALALVNRGGASASELLALARQIRDGVRDRLGIELVSEPVIV